MAALARELGVRQEELLLERLFLGLSDEQTRAAVLTRALAKASDATTAQLLVEVSELLPPDRRANLSEQMLLSESVDLPHRARVASTLLVKGLPVSQRRPTVLQLLQVLPQSERLELLQGVVDGAPYEELLALVRARLEGTEADTQELFVSQLCKVLPREVRATMAGSLLAEMDAEERGLLLRGAVSLMSSYDREQLQERLAALGQL